MKTIGIIGGIGPETTLEYYKRIIAAHRERRNDRSYPAIVITSIDAKRLIRPIMAGEHDRVVELLLAEIARLQRACGGVPVLDTTQIHAERIVDESLG